MQESTMPTDFNEQIENSLRDLLEKILNFFEQIISTKEEVKFIEEQLNDYDSLLTLISIIKKLFLHLQRKITEKFIKNKSTIENNTDTAFSFQKSNVKNIEIDPADYELLEKVVQKYEAEIRNHIRVEQQLKLFGETLQAKLDESEKIRNEVLESSKKLINDIKRDNQELNDKFQRLSDNYSNLEKKLKKTELDRTLLENQIGGLGLFPYRYTGEKTDKTQHTNPTLNSINDHSFQKVNLELDYSKNNESIQKNSTNKTPEKFLAKKRNFSPQTLLNNLINNQKKEKNLRTDCLKLKIEIARGNIISQPNKKRLPHFQLKNLSQNNEENIIFKTDGYPSKSNSKNLAHNKTNSHNNSLAANHSIQDSGDEGIIRPRSKSSHSRNNKSFSYSNKNPIYSKAKKKTEKTFHFMKEGKQNLNVNDSRNLVFNYLKTKNQIFNVPKK